MQSEPQKGSDILHIQSFDFVRGEG